MDFAWSRGFAEYVAVPVWNLVELPEYVSYEEAAMLEPMAVAVHAMRLGTGEFTLDKAAPVAVCGLGAVGLLLAMFLMEAGYRNLYVAGNKDFQRKRAESLGILAEYYLDSGKAGGAERLRECTGGAALFFECTGRNEAFSMGIDGAGPMGRVVLVGNPGTDMALEKDTCWKILRNQLAVLGTWNSSFKGRGADDWNYVLERMETHRITPAGLISHRFRLEELKDGLSMMRGKRQDFCKVIVAAEPG